MNILIVTESFYPDDVGGVHSCVYNLAKGLVKKGHGVWLMTLKLKSNAPSNENIEGINIFRYNSATTGGLIYFRRPLFSILNSCALFKKLSREIKFDIINFNSVLPAFGITLSGKSKKISKIFTFHASMYQEVMIQSRKKRYAFFLNPIIFLAIRLIEKICLKKSNKIIVLSQFNRQQLFKLYNVEPAKIALIPGGVDIEKFKPSPEAKSIRENLKLPPNKIIILTVRRLVVRMGLEELVYAMKKVVEKEKNVLLIIGGDGFLRSELQRLIETLNLKDNIVLLGPVSSDDLILYYQASDFFVLPTQYLEGFGIVTLEALASGLPVLGTPIGGTKEILERLDKSLLFKSASIEDITNGIKNFISEKEQWHKMGSRCREYVISNYSWEKIVSDNENLFSNQING